MKTDDVHLNCKSLLMYFIAFFTFHFAIYCAHWRVIYYYFNALGFHVFEIVYLFI